MSAHSIFYIPELLETILLQTDMRTLLTSCLRVCRTWHNLITHSTPLQKALFFKPSTDQQGQKRKQNPFLEEVWHELFRKRVYTQSPVFRCYSPKDACKNEAVYLRETASWRRMLIQQPSTSLIGVIEADLDNNLDGLLFTAVEFKPCNDFIRLGSLYTSTDAVFFGPGREARLLWSGPWSLEQQEEIFGTERALAVSKYLNDFDLVIFIHEGATWDQEYTALRKWMLSFGGGRFLEGRYRQAVNPRDYEL